ncbi:MAG: AAA family ATPase [Acidimicrobiales bacterium]|jgi:MoxR-like ATPase|nr:ATPase [Acidimicrobiaceae bacterium]MEC7427547.1 MoxR family ATPase [Actinomycetota bacterium]MEC9089096.1 MoxR family ATPase [Actinomycetota bacterium]HAQ42777.1 ATPase [Acidimicrobiaceae bacterium]|tara:strand:+ start:12378 stop:13283 length:906 start_codon:yes stop_codon:yes gene_type:complete
MFEFPDSPAAVSAALSDHNYLTDEGLSTVVYLAMTMERPLFLEGDAGVGKTELAKVLAAWTGGELIRLQCYEGIDASQALYEWDYTRQLLHLRTAEALGRAESDSLAVEDELYSDRFLIRRPLLQAIDYSGDHSPVLLIDEVDRADDEFEAFLLEVLSDHSVTIPELGTLGGGKAPLVVVTSNRTRDVHDALKRRCLYHWVNHPDLEREIEIIRLKSPEADAALARQVALAVQAMRGMGLYKPPGVAETIDWSTALGKLGESILTEETITATLGTVLKYREDQERVSGQGIEMIMAAAANG